jgi:hypothetical protein
MIGQRIMNFKPDKKKMKDHLGRYITQSLFLEPNYNEEFAIYTFDGEDKTYNGNVYFSLKKLYLASDDPMEYDFANTFLYDWNHWKRLCSNAIIMRHIQEWRDELELKLMSEGVRMMIDQAEDNQQAAKWLAERGWSKRGAGRPKKEEIEFNKKLHEQLDEEFGNDVVRMSDYK